MPLPNNKLIAKWLALTARAMVMSTIEKVETAKNSTRLLLGISTTTPISFKNNYFLAIIVLLMQILATKFSNVYQ
jgi:hypothetical protein